MILADNGSNWFISGETNPDCWNDDDLNQLKGIPGTAFEAVVSPAPPSAPGELIANGGFEGADSRQALAWTTNNPSGGRRTCNEMSAIYGVYKQVAFEGHCAYKFKATSTGSKIQQKLNAANFAAGDTLVISTQANGKNVPQGSARVDLKVKYSDGTKDKFVLSIPAGTYAYTLQTATHTLGAIAPAKVKVSVVYAGTSGKLTVDAVSLTKATAATRLPLP
jgi:hypothetical protein